MLNLKRLNLWEIVAIVDPDGSFSVYRHNGQVTGFENKQYVVYDFNLHTFQQYKREDLRPLHMDKAKQILDHLALMKVLYDQIGPLWFNLVLPELKRQAHNERAKEKRHTRKKIKLGLRALEH